MTSAVSERAQRARERNDCLKRIRGDPNIQTSANTDTSALPVPCAKTGLNVHDLSSQPLTVFMKIVNERSRTFSLQG